MDWRHGLRSRAPVLQAQSPEFKPSSHHPQNWPTFPVIKFYELIVCSIALKVYFAAYMYAYMAFKYKICLIVYIEKDKKMNRSRCSNNVLFAPWITWYARDQ
jgi:hypothetical protein